MRFYLNEVSLQGQFEDDKTFKASLQVLLAARSRSPILAGMRTTPALADRPVMHGYSLRQVVQGWKGSPVAGVLLAWVGRNGPFIEADRLSEAEDLFQCFGLEVTEGGLGESARRMKAGEVVASVSFTGGTPDFSVTPLPVVHGFEDAPIATYDVRNFWDPGEALAEALRFESPPGSWREMIESARPRFPHLILPDAIFKDQRLARDPFDAVIRDRVYALLDVLNSYMDDRDENGLEGEFARSIIRDHFTGERALFSPESKSNRDDFKDELTFPDPMGGEAIFAHWHGKISHRFYRVHFAWPLVGDEKRLKVVYIGPKLTKR